MFRAKDPLAQRRGDFRNLRRSNYDFLKRILKPLDRECKKKKIIKVLSLISVRWREVHEHTRRIRDMPSVLVNEIPRSDEFEVRNATSRVARLRYATRDYLLHMLFLFSLPFFSPPSAREMAL